MNTITLGRRTIGAEHPPFIVAELSGNHQQSLDRALALVDAAADAGADAVKLQTFTADTMTLDCDAQDFVVTSNNPLWEGENLYRLYHRAQTPWEWHRPIFERARAKGLLAFSTPCDDTAVEFLESLEVPVYKVASFENNHFPLLKRIASTGKPVIMSTGMSRLEDLGESVSVLTEAGCRELILLKCTSTYPADPAECHLQTIPYLAKAFDCIAGLSDHTLGIGVPVAAVALGARVIEKHVTLDRNDGGVDSGFSLEPHELKQLVEESRKAFEALGRVSFELSPREQANRAYKRSIYISKDLEAGNRLSRDNVRIVRPGKGLAPKYFDVVLGKQVKQPIRRGTALTWDLIA